MEKLSIHIDGFKCFERNAFEFNKLTLLTGANASGKSSVIQALLFLKAASESDERNTVLNLVDSRYAFDFGDPDSLINNELLTDEVSISLSNGSKMRFNGGSQGKERRLYVQVDNLKSLKASFAKGLTYFCAERQGPRFDYTRNTTEIYACGCRGENTGNVMSECWNTKINGARLYKPSSGDFLFNIALDGWIDYIFPGISIRIQQVGSQSYQVMIRDNHHNMMTDSTNIGFGISYALPIIVGALLAHDGSWFVVENPEAHIHAKAQSNIGYFLGMMAAAGLRVLVETHSEHVVNGVRRAAIISGRLHSEDVNIYFFRGKSESELITLDSLGNLSDFPVDFFDQSRQDMMQIINNSRKGWEMCEEAC